MDTFGLALLLETLNAPCECELIGLRVKPECYSANLNRWWIEERSPKMRAKRINTNAKRAQ